MTSIRAVETVFTELLEKARRAVLLSPDEVTLLFEVEGERLEAVIQAADRMRAEACGEDVSYVVNRNINFTNVCAKRCKFCAFSRTYRSEEGYLLPISEIVRRAQEAQAYGATEVCIQAGLLPDMEGDLYIRICHAVQEALPKIHIHAFSPEEILYGCSRSGVGVREYLRRLRDVGLGSLPGTSAEILVQEVRDRIAPGRISVEDWKKVVITAHSLGIRTTSTIMYGHVESARDLARHLILLRDLQRETGGFTEFVPLSFVSEEAPLYRHELLPDVRSGATRSEVLRMHAVSRLVLGPWIPNIQVSWVKEGLDLSEACLGAGANDLGGTLINESISTSAGARYGQLASPRELRRRIRRAGRIPVERSTLYKPLRRFEQEGSAPRSKLDDISDASGKFGSYDRLTASEKYRYSSPSRGR